MSEELIERVAEAMCAAINGDKSSVVQWSKLHREERELYEIAARAALEAARYGEMVAEMAELRAERDALLEKPIDMAKMDSIDEDASGKMVAYYWWQQAQDVRALLSSIGASQP